MFTDNLFNKITARLEFLHLSNIHWMNPTRWLVQRALGCLAGGATDPIDIDQLRNSILKLVYDSDMVFRPLWLILCKYVKPVVSRARYWPDLLEKLKANTRKVVSFPRNAEYQKLWVFCSFCQVSICCGFSTFLKLLWFFLFCWGHFYHS